MLKSPSSKWTIRTAAILLLCLALAPALLAQDRVECGAVKSVILAQDVRYCAILPPGYARNQARRYPVLYYLHGLGESEQALAGPLWEAIERLHRTGQIGEFLVVTPNGGRTFYINSRDGRYRYEDFFIREFMPEIERKYRVEPGRARRAISGTSMGGYGALRFAFKYPRMFAGVSAMMPALYENLPGPIADALTLTTRGPAQGDLFGQPFDEAYWRKNTPFTLAREHAAEIRGQKIYFNCGNQDDYGFDAGTRQLDKLLTSLKIPHETRLYDGGHNGYFVAAHLPESFGFISRAITGK